MAFNRLADAAYDARNPRTAGRHLPAGLLTRGGVLAFLLVNAALFIVCAGLLNTLTLALSVPALIAVCFYSLTKRFTSWSHLFLGLAIGISPVGAWVAVRGAFGAEAMLLCLSLLFWIAGFDIIYAAQDENFDRGAGLHSLVVRHGRKGAMRISRALHALMLAVLILIEAAFALGWPYRAALAATAVLIAWLHLFRRSDSLDDLNQDFFIGNVAVSVVIFLGITLSILVQTL
jgi:4-hydroxybenzoate polyprenyltransferase